MRILVVNDDGIYSPGIATLTHVARSASRTARRRGPRHRGPDASATVPKRRPAAVVRALRRRVALDRREFDASWNRGEPFEFPLGVGKVIAGWDQGVAGMKVGGRRRLTIPPHLAYGDRGAGGVIKPGETLVFVVDLVGVQ